jgi:thiol-disulfide isomerase/thioredoxin
MHVTRYQQILITGLCIVFILITAPVSSEQLTEVNQEVTNPEINTAESAESPMAWTKISMTDAVSGERFTIDEIAGTGKPVILHTFAVWCSACLMQLRETERLYAADPDAFTIIGIDLDPNENQDLVKRHIEKNKFPGRYAAAPKELSNSLIDTFGVNFFTDLPQTVVICNKTITKMGSSGGLFREQTLKDALFSLCG